MTRSTHDLMSWISRIVVTNQFSHHKRPSLVKELKTMKISLALLFGFFAVAASQDVKCCGTPTMAVCCKQNDEYKCVNGYNVCTGAYHGWQKSDGQGKCGAGNNGVLCAAPKGGDIPTVPGGCSCRINNECKPMEDCQAFLNMLKNIINNYLHWVIIGACVIVALCTALWYVHVSSSTPLPWLKTTNNNFVFFFEAVHAVSVAARERSLSWQIVNTATVSSRCCHMFSQTLVHTLS